MKVLGIYKTQENLYALSLVEDGTKLVYSQLIKANGFIFALEKFINEAGIRKTEIDLISHLESFDENTMIVNTPSHFADINTYLLYTPFVENKKDNYSDLATIAVFPKTLIIEYTNELINIYKRNHLGRITKFASIDNQIEPIKQKAYQFLQLELNQSIEEGDEQAYDFGIFYNATEDAWQTEDINIKITDLYNNRYNQLLKQTTDPAIIKEVVTNLKNDLIASLNLAIRDTIIAYTISQAVKLGYVNIAYCSNLQDSIQLRSMMTRIAEESGIDLKFSEIEDKTKISSGIAASAYYNYLY